VVVLTVVEETSWRRWPRETRGTAERLRRVPVHELSICYGILEAAIGALEPLPRPLPRVERGTMRIGRLTAVVPDTLKHYFDLLAPGPDLEGTRAPPAPAQSDNGLHVAYALRHFFYGGSN
jgi:hypothetical protein